MTLSDFVIDFLTKKGITDIFLVSGGGVMYLTDAVYRNKKIHYYTNRHEQACAIAAEAYARVKNHISACLVTSGPGATNAITGVACAWFDSIPMIVISGQQKRELIADYSKNRNLGPQEVNIIPMIKPITKYAVQIKDPEKIRYELEKAYYYANEGRPGPSWLDIPLDLQGVEINKKNLIFFKHPAKKDNKKNLKSQVKEVMKMLQNSHRPVLIFGNGVRISGATDLLVTLLKKLPFPVLLPFNECDLIDSSYRLFMGKFGPFGNRMGNFTLQNSDLVLSIGASLNIASIGFNYKGVAPRAKKIMVNIDKGELTKPTLSVDFPIQADAKEFIEELLKQIKNQRIKINPKWQKVCELWKNRYPPMMKEYFHEDGFVNSYIFFDKLVKLTLPKDVVTTGIGLDGASLFQVFRVKKGQRAFLNKNFGPMGWCLPAAVGASIANNKKRTICVTGDGSFQFNLQELLTIDYYRLPIKIFIFNNQGYESIRYTQTNLFKGRFVGADKNTGVQNPKFNLLAQSLNFSYFQIKTNDDIVNKINKALRTKGPVLCEVNISPTQKRMPRVSSYRKPDGSLESKPLEDMWPFLPEEEVKQNMSLFD